MDTTPLRARGGGRSRYVVGYSHGTCSGTDLQRMWCHLRDCEIDLTEFVGANLFLTEQHGSSDNPPYSEQRRLTPDVAVASWNGDTG
jgi:hypothetical protein